MKTLKRLAALLTGTAALTATTMGVASAATIPPHTPSTAVVEEINNSFKPQWYKLQNADPMGGDLLNAPSSAAVGILYQIRWTGVSSTEVHGTGKYEFYFAGRYASGPVVIALYGKGYRYTCISATATQEWYGNNGLGGVDPPYGHGTYHTTKPTYLASNIPTTDFDRL
jgi:hypothetical protein